MGSRKNRILSRRLLLRGLWVVFFAAAWRYQWFWQVLVFFLLAFSYLVYRQDRILYVSALNGEPRKNSSNARLMRSPAEWKIPFEELMLKTKDNVRIHGWFLTQPDFDLQRRVPTMLCLHGNVGNIGQRLQNWAGFFYNLRYNLLVLEYRGYGESEGTPTPSEEGLVLDAVAGLEFLANHKHIDRSQIVIFGCSLGGAVAVALASSTLPIAKRISGVILENTFLSVLHMAGRVFLPLRLLPRALLRPFLRSQWSNDHSIRRVQAPILFLCSTKDGVVGPGQMKALYERACARDGTWLEGRERKDAQRIEFFEAGHDDIFLKEPAKYYLAVGRFVSSLTKDGSGSFARLLMKDNKVEQIREPILSSGPIF